MLTDDRRSEIKLAASMLTGHKRRRYMAEMALKYCGGSPRKAEQIFGWGRDAVRTGLGEKRTGIRCLDNYAARGRKKTEEKYPELAREVERIVEPHAQADPKFQTATAYTRITARKVREELLKKKRLKPKVPCRQAVGTMLNRMGYKLRRVMKSRPEKKDSGNG